MSAKTKNLWTKSLIITAAILFSTAAPSVPAQDDAAPRRLWDGAFLKKRAEGKASTTSRKSTAYRRATPKKAPAPNAGSQTPAQNTVAQNQKVEGADGEMIGLTIWRLRPSRAEDGKDSRLLLINASNQKTEWTPERVEADTVFNPGDNVRLSVESPRDGYIYVIDREIYSDGKTSDPYLIFPSLDIRGGANSVSAGKVIELPDQQSPFILGSALGNPQYAGEQLTILVAPEPLKNVQIGSGPVKLDPATVAQWEAQWAGSIERFEMVGGAGKPLTKAEKEASQDGSRALTQNDEMPQTLYHVDVKQGAPLLVKVPLRTSK
jgi:hypothetical protein